MSCVNTKSKEFIETAKRLDLSSGTLELIVHEFQNTEGNEGNFPSDSYILERVKGESMTTASLDQVKLWNSKYSKPIIVTTPDMAKQVAIEAARFFPKPSIKIHSTYDGKYKVTVSRPYTSPENNDIYLNRQVANILNTLRDLKWIEIYNKDAYEHGVLRYEHGKYYITLGNILRELGNSEDVKKHFTNILQSQGIPTDSFTLRETKVSNTEGLIIEVSIKDDVIDREEIQLSTDTAASKKAKEAMLKLHSFLKERIPALKGIHFISRQEAIKKGIDSSTNAFTEDGEIYIIGGRGNLQIVSEEALHIFINYVQESNPKLFNSLLEEARKTFPKLYAEIEVSYSDKSQETRNNELVTQALARYFAEEFENTSPNNRKTFKEVVSNLFSFIADFFNSLFKDNVVDAKELPNMSLLEIAQLLNTSDSTWLSKINKEIQKNKDITTSNNTRGNDLSSYNFYSGGAKGSDTAWSEEAEKLGITTKHYTPKDWDNLSDEWKNKLDTEYQEVVSMLGRKVLAEDSYSGKLVRRDMMQADKADAIFAIGTIASNGYVNGGTGYATTRGIIRGIPVYLFDQADSKWKVWNNESKSFVGTSIPKLTPNAATIGTRELKDNGRQAIRDILKASLTKDTTETKQVAETTIQEQETTKDTKPLTIDEKHHQMSIDLKNKIDNIMSSELISTTEVTAIAEDIAYFISETISELHDNPSLLFDKFPDKRTLDKEGNWTEENKNRDFNKAMMMTRLELVNFISPANLMNLCKETFNKSTSMRTGKKVRFIKNNWSAFVSLGSSIFSSLEKFNIGDTLAEAVDDSVNSADPNSEKDEDEIKELTGNLQEHWQTKVTTQKVVNTMSQLMKQAIRSLLDIDENGNPKVNEYGRPKRVNFKDAINSITYWVVGSTNIQDMVDKLRIQAKEHPWVNQLITKLTDTSGNEALFQSQFFSTFNLAQQSYSIVEKIDNKYVAKPVNETPALKDAIDTITTLYKMNIHPLFDDRGNVDIEQMKKLVSLYEELKNIEELNDSNTEHAVNIITSILNLLGHSSTSKEIKSSINNNIIARTVELLDSIINTTRENFRKATYAPFTFNGDGNITSYVKNLISPFITNREAIIEKATYSDGEMHQTHVLHSYLTKLMDKFKLEGDKFEEFLLNTYDIPWFKDPNKYEFGEGWKNVWLKMLATNKEARKVFKHVVVLNFNKKNYMKNMTESEYLLEILAMYNSESGKGDLVPAWFRIPMMSNKPSSEFLRFYSYRGSGYRESIVSGIYQIFLQELGRIQAVKMRKNTVSKDDKIKNFDKNGEKFCFLNYLNSYLTDGSELGTLINRKVNGEQLSPDETTKLMSSAKEAIRSYMYSYVEMVKQSWENAGILKVANDTISGFDADNFIWNDTFAAMNILQLTVTDIAFNKDAEDLQKRFAQIHAPGARCNIYATDFNGNRVSDGISRTLIINDFKGLVSNIVENVKIVYDKKIANAKTEEERNSLKILRDYLVKDPVYNEDGSIKEQGVFYDINLTDAQAYNSPTSYRKKAIMFGKWGKSQEELYQKIISGKATYSDLQVMFQPLKPFVYSQKRVDLGITEGMTNTNVPFQCKNSEYLLILADAIIQGENTGKPNLLRVLYEVMEESATKNNRKGIDTIQFDSAIKSGLSGSVDLSSFMSMENGEEKAKEYLESLIYKDNTTEYNKTYIHEFPFEDFCLQQEVPAHFRNHEQAHGSQERYIVISDLENTDNESNLIYYNVRGQQLTKAQIQERYEKLISENIEDDLQELSQELHLDSLNKKDRNIALSRVLVKEILDNPRYGVDLLYACLVDENGDFNIPLGDPIQAKRVEQLLNSIIKNRVNKQTIAGGPVVQVSNFGTSRELNIVFKSKELDENGNNKLLKTRKEFNGTDAEYKEYITKNQAGIAHFEVFAPVYMKETLSMFINPDGTIDIEAIEATDPDLLKMIGYRIPTEDKYSISPLKIVGFLPREAGEGIMLPADITLLTGSDFDVDKEYLMIKKLDIITKPTNTIFWSMYHALKQGKKYAKREALKEEIGDFLGNIEMMKSTHPELWNTYKKVAYKTTEPKSARDRRNNEILDITYAIMSHETVADQILNPGNFEPQKKMGYLVEALRTTGMSYEKLSNMTVEELKEYATKNKNLSFIDVHTQFYKQNSAAGSLIGTFAVHKVGHAVLEGNGFKLKVLDACGATEPFEIAGMTFTDSMEIDPTKNSKGELIGKVLGSLVASSVDAVKDPILNLMNINKNTSGILTTLVRLGMPFEDAALFLSQKAVTELLQEYESKAVNEYTSLNKELESKITKLTKDVAIEASSELFKMPILKEDLITGITESSPEHTLKVLKAFQRISLLATELRTITFATRFNSITSAVGPLVIDTLMLEHNMEKFSEYITDADDNYVTMKDVFEKHPILKSFANTIPLANRVLADMLTGSSNFRSLIYCAGDTIANKLLSDRKILSKLGDFYQSYLLVASGVIDSSEIEYYISKFPKEFFATIKTNPKYSNNLLIQAIKPQSSRKTSRIHLNIDTSGMDNESKDPLMSSWTDLHKTDPELALKLFKYCFFRGGIGYNPKTFMYLVSVFFKKNIPNYINTFKNKPSVVNINVIDQFVRNNWDDNKLVPRKKAKGENAPDGILFDFTQSNTLRITDPGTILKMKNTPYFKMKIKGVDVILKMIINEEDRLEYSKVQPLGNNGEYLELSTRQITKPISITEECIPDDTESEVQEISKSETEESMDIPQEDMELSAYEKALSIIELDSSITNKEDAVQKLQEYRNKSKKEQEELENSMINYITKKMASLGLSTSSDEVQSVYNEFTKKENICE